MINNARRWAPRGLWRYGVSVLALAAALGARLALHPLLGEHLPDVFFMTAAIAIECSLGMGPAILVVVLGLPLADFFFVPPFRQFGDLDHDDVILIIGFPTVTLGFVAVIEWLRRTQYEARLIAEVARSRLAMLQRAETRRVKMEKSISISNRLLLNISDDRDDVLYIGRVGSKYEYMSPTLSRELDLKATGTGGQRLMAALHPDDASELAHHLDGANDVPRPISNISLPRKNRQHADLPVQVETFVTTHGDYVVIKALGETPT